MPRFFCIMINKWNLPRETTQVACPVSFRNRKPGLDNGRMSLASLLIQTCKHLLYWIFPNVGECTGYLYSVGSLPNISSISQLGRSRAPGCHANVAACHRCYGLCCEMGRAGTLGNAGSRCVVNIDVIAAWCAARPQRPPGRPFSGGCPCVLCTEDRARASPQRPVLRWVSDLERTVVHCDFMRENVACRVFPTSQTLGLSSPTHTHTAALRCSVCRRIWETLCPQLCPKLVSVRLRLVWPSVLFENLHLIGFWKAGFMLSLPEPHDRSHYKCIYTAKLFYRENQH